MINTDDSLHAYCACPGLDGGFGISRQKNSRVGPPPVLIGHMGNCAGKPNTGSRESRHQEEIGEATG